MARKSGRAHMAWVRSFRKGRKHSPRRRRRARRNPYPVAGIALNPRRRRRSVARSHRRRARRNPPRSIMRGLPTIQSVVYAGVGFVGTPIVEGMLSAYLPLSITANTFGKYAVRIGTVLGLTWAAKMVVGKKAAQMVGLGGGVYVAVTAVKEFAPGLIPGMSAYALPGSGMGAYLPSTGRNYTQMGAIPFRSSGTGETVSKRFQRF